MTLNRTLRVTSTSEPTVNSRVVSFCLKNITIIGNALVKLFMPGPMKMLMLTVVMMKTMVMMKAMMLMMIYLVLIMRLMTIYLMLRSKREMMLFDNHAHDDAGSTSLIDHMVVDDDDDNFSGKSCSKQGKIGRRQH